MDYLDANWVLTLGRYPWRWSIYSPCQRQSKICGGLLALGERVQHSNYALIPQFNGFLDKFTRHRFWIGIGKYCQYSDAKDSVQG